MAKNWKPEKHPKRGKTQDVPNHLPSSSYVRVSKGAQPLWPPEACFFTFFQIKTAKDFPMDDSALMVLELGSKGYSCAQIILAGGLRLMGEENTLLLRAAAGLAQGGGCSGELCGALSGGLCLIALHTAKGRDAETPLENTQLLQQELVEWFRQDVCQGGSITCDALLGTPHPADACPTMNPVTCGSLVAKVWDKTLALLLENGIDPSSVRSVP